MSSGIIDKIEPFELAVEAAEVTTINQRRAMLAAQSIRLACRDELINLKAMLCESANSRPAQNSIEELRQRVSETEAKLAELESVASREVEKYNLATIRLLDAHDDLNNVRRVILCTLEQC